MPKKSRANRDNRANSTQSCAEKVRANRDNRANSELPELEDFVPFVSAVNMSFITSRVLGIHDRWTNLWSDT